MGNRERWFRAMAGGFGRKPSHILELIGLIALVLLFLVMFWP